MEMRYLFALTVSLLLVWPAHAALTLGTWQTAPGSPMPTARAQHFAVTDPATGDVYVGGGYNVSAASPLNSVDIFHPSTVTWSSAAALPIATRGAAAAYSGGKIYVFGGADTNRITSAQIYDIAANTWSTAPFAQGDWEAGAATLPDGTIMITGGISTGQNLVYNPTTGAFTSRAFLPVGRDGLETAYVGGKLVAAGGFSSITPVADVDAYDPAGNTWSTAPANLASPRARMASAVYDNHLMVVGGTTAYTNGASPQFTNFDVYDPIANAWAPGPNFLFPIREAAAAVSGDRLIVFGGANAGGISTGVTSILVPEPAGLLTGLVGIALTARRRRSESR
jgi:N-acetylneuraminic acid mutarotase